MFLYWLFIGANVSPRFLLRTENQFAVGLDAFLLQRRAKKLPNQFMLSEHAIISQSA